MRAPTCWGAAKLEAAKLEAKLEAKSLFEGLQGLGNSEGADRLRNSFLRGKNPISLAKAHLVWGIFAITFVEIDSPKSERTKSNKYSYLVGDDTN